MTCRHFFQLLQIIDIEVSYPILYYKPCLKRISIGLLTILEGLMIILQGMFLSTIWVKLLSSTICFVVRVLLSTNINMNLFL